MITISNFHHFQFYLLSYWSPSLIQVQNHNFKQRMCCVWCQGWGNWMAAEGKLTSNTKVKWHVGQSKVSISVSPFQTSHELSSRKRPSQLLADVFGRMFHWQTRGATVWWYHWSLLICISLAERAVTLQSGLVCLVSDAQPNWLWPMTGYFNLLIAHIFS